MGKFEEHIKKAVEQYEVDYNPQHWAKVESQLAVKPSGGLAKKIAVGSAILVAGIAVTYFATKPEQVNLTPKAIEQTPVIENNEVVTQPTSIPAEVKEDNKQELSTPVQQQKAESITEEKPTETKPVASSEKVVEQTENKEEKPISDKTSKASVWISQKEACVEERVEFKVSVNEPVSFVWNFGDGNTSDLPEPTHQYAKAGNYRVSVELVSLITGKTTKVYGDKIIAVNPKPAADFDYYLNEPNDFKQQVSLNAGAGDFKLVEWLVNGKTYNRKSVDIPLNYKGNYPVRFVASNSFGCYDTLVKSIRIENDYNLLAPNAFTPDNDGINDVFLPKALSTTNLRYDLEVYEAATGKLVHKSNQDIRGWDGMDIRTGAKATKGDYAWTVNLYRENGEVEIFKGTLKLLQQ